MRRDVINDLGRAQDALQVARGAEGMLMQVAEASALPAGSVATTGGRTAAIVYLLALGLLMLRASALIGRGEVRAARMAARVIRYPWHAAIVILDYPFCQGK